VEKVAQIPEPSDEAILKKKKIAAPEELDSMVRRSVATEDYLAGLAGQVSSNPFFFKERPVIQPVAGSAALTATFGKQIDPFTGNSKWHHGVDFAAERKTPVVATAGGMVIAIENNRLWGLRIQIAHGHGFSTVYAHLGEIVAYKGKKVSQGEIIGTVGISGLSTGPHVHYEIWYGDKPVDPMEYFYPETALASADGVQ
jgi:murein DD-endopeptidase MepM/ murein hydrolase activator NlpD